MSNVKDFLIKKIDPSSVMWSEGRGRISPYKIIYQTIRKMKEGEAISIKLDKKDKNFSCKMHQNLRNGRVGFIIRLRRLDEDGCFWAIKKVVKNV